MKAGIRTNRLNRIIEYAEDVFLDNGFSRTNISDICKRANCSRTTLYTHFNSKENLYLAVVNKSFEHFIDYFSKLDVREENGKAQLLKLAEGYLNFAQAQPKNYTLIIDFYSILKKINQQELLSATEKLLLECSYFAEVRQLATYPAKILTKIIAKGQKDGSINEDIAAEVLFINLWAYLLGSSQLLNTAAKDSRLDILGVTIKRPQRDTLYFVSKLLR